MNSLRKSKILLVENDPVFRNILTRILVREGYDVYSASNAREALHHLSTFSVELLITDLRIQDDRDAGDTSGLGLAEAASATTPVVIMTAFPALDVIRAALQKGNRPIAPAVDFVAKSEGVEGLLNAVKAILTEARSRYLGYPTGGALTQNELPFYVTRQAEQEVIERIQRMEYVLILEPRQQGKTSLINFLFRAPVLGEFIIVYVDIATIGGTPQALWYQNLGGRILQQLRDRHQRWEWPPVPQDSTQWRSFLSRVSSHARGFKNPLLIALDEIGSTMPDAAGFFSVLRDAFNSRQFESQFNSMTFLLAGSFHPRELITDARISPFNVAHRVRLPDFSLEQVRFLADNLDCSAEEKDLIAGRIFFWSSGQPYLCQRLCASIGSLPSVDEVDKAVAQLCREDDNHLPHLMRNLNQDAAALSYLEKIIQGERFKFLPSISPIQSKLELLGAIKSDSRGFCAIRNRIYLEILMAKASVDNPDVGYDAHEDTDV